MTVNGNDAVITASLTQASISSADPNINAYYYLQLDGSFDTTKKAYLRFSSDDAPLRITVTNASLNEVIIGAQPLSNTPNGCMGQIGFTDYILVGSTCPNNAASGS